MFKNTEGVRNNLEKTGNTRRRKTKQKHSTICVGHHYTQTQTQIRDGSRRWGGAHPARAPPKIGKNMIVWRQIVIFHTKYPKTFRASPRTAQFF
jgi:hypothetical protein